MKIKKKKPTISVQIEDVELEFKRPAPREELELLKNAPSAIFALKKEGDKISAESELGINDRLWLIEYQSNKLDLMGRRLISCKGLVDDNDQPFALSDVWGALPGSIKAEILEKYDLFLKNEAEEDAKKP